MSGSEATPGFEMTGGSLGQGLSQAVGMALGLRLDGRAARVFNLLSDGELQEGATWEAAMAAAHYGLDRLFAFVDCNNQQADGPPAHIMGVEPVHVKWEAFGWHTQRIDGNDIQAISAALEGAKQEKGRPHAIILDTLMGRGVPLFEQREKSHFIRVDPEEWALARQQLEQS
jgi:transketolase